MFKFLVNMAAPVALLAATSAFALDPTQPPAARTHVDAPVQEVATLQLQAILRGAGRASAVINGQYLEVGERLGDAQILAIGRHSVVIERQGQKQDLRLSAPIIQTSRTLP